MLLDDYTGHAGKEVSSDMAKEGVHCCRGIIYRDVKPDNFLYLTPDASSVKATDFGLSIRCRNTHTLGQTCIARHDGTRAECRLSMSWAQLQHAHPCGSLEWRQALARRAKAAITKRHASVHGARGAARVTRSANCTTEPPESHLH